MYLDQARAVSQLGDADALPPMLTMLEESLERDIPAIDACIKSGDMVGANQLLHPIKGFLPIFCGDGLCDELSHAESLSKGSSAQELSQAYAGLRPKLVALLAEVTAFLQTTAAR